MSVSSPVALICHPDTPAAGVRAIRVDFERGCDGGLRLAYRLEGELDGLRIPAVATPLPPERLWAYTCFEVFVGVAGAEAYREFNFSPNGQWARFDFATYRGRVPSPVGPAPRLDIVRSVGALSLAANLEAACLPAGELRLGITAVVEHGDGHHSYWALAHPPGKPDFHHRDGFAVALKAPTP
ncbi:DOMON-like domain-containing protein [Zoogloea sp. LCSB751]|uniref:DOMON-like domain-containing protein n=1 Tax=Zoogloea sp. LCSB751 TaxID=1965277 RepID=UPI0009A53739|nr:DOMON-like domain-containing protein [Zoogloea sp. LCSB751]